MNNDDWLNNLAYCFGLDSGISQDNSAISTASPDLPQTIDLNKSLEQPIPPAHDVTPSLPDANTDILSPHHHYDPSHFQGIVIGNPDEAMKHFQTQNHADTCGIAVQQSIIEDTTGVHLSENQLIQTAQNHDLYHQGMGTPVSHVGDLVSLETNVPVEKHFGGSLAEIAEKIANGEHVMVSVNAQIANVPDSQSILGSLSSQILDSTVQNNQVANHVEEVIGIGIKNNDPLHPVVIVNDPSSVDGKGVEIPAEQFTAAWETGGNFMASTVNHPEALLNNLGGNHVDNQHLTDYNVGCKVSTYDKNVYIDADKVGNYNGNTFYWISGKVAGTWSCDTHHAYTRNGRDLGYAPTWSDAALLIYKQD
jgi:hypothetical protein